MLSKRLTLLSESEQHRGSFLKGVKGLDLKWKLYIFIDLLLDSNAYDKPVSKEITIFDHVVPCFQLLICMVVMAFFFIKKFKCNLINHVL